MYRNARGKVSNPKLILLNFIYLFICVCVCVWGGGGGAYLMLNGTTVTLSLWYSVVIFSGVLANILFYGAILFFVRSETRAASSKKHPYKNNA